ncbi:tripartite motif-containing protein 2-like [Anneissia japonica]|uniref:tripartite motif-containing protein 2-like n=1 Tax=Anneissia japonica TaxID=1529436 RepID=UPI00142599DE|nr:tripartite motif-containing protein 2-like [Anneissia japonica]
MNTFVEDVENALECSICLKRLQQPKSLGCLHTFCLDCLQNWVEKQGKLVCPTCRQSQMIPEGGLQNLLPNIFVNNMLECLEKVENAGDTVCCCCSQTKADFYCQQCRTSLCSVCIKQHKILSTLVSHTLHPIEKIKTMTLQQFSSLHPALCPEHNEPLKYYCTKCETAICIHCTIIKHKDTDGSHNYIDISDAFDKFKQRVADIEPNIMVFKTKIEMRHNDIRLGISNLTKHKETCEKEIDGLVEEVIEVVRENGAALKKDVDCIYQQKRLAFENHDKELNTIFTNVTKRWNYISNLLKSDVATAVGSCEKAIATLKESVQTPSEIEAKCWETIHFSHNKGNIIALKQHGIGKIIENYIAGEITENDIIASEITENLALEDHFEIIQASDELMSVTQKQVFEVKFVQRHSCKLDLKSLRAILVHATGATMKKKVKEEGNGSYSVSFYSKSPGVARVHVCVDERDIKGSPVDIIVEKSGYSWCFDIESYKKNSQTRIRDVVFGKFIIVAGNSNEILRFYGGSYVDSITLPSGTKVNRMYQMKKSDDLLLSDGGHKRILVYSKFNLNKILKWFELKEPHGLTMNEKTDMVYVADRQAHCIFIYDLHCNQLVEKVGLQGSHYLHHMSAPRDVAITKDGHIIVADYGNDRLLLLTCEGSPVKSLLDGAVYHPCGINVDPDGNIIVANNEELELYDSKGGFIKRINDLNVDSDDESDDGILDKIEGLTILLEDCPRSVAVADYGDNKIKIFNY